jgi:Peptidase family M23
LLPSLAVLKSDNKEASVRRLALVLVCALALPVSTARAWTWPVDGPVLRPFVFDHDSPHTAGQHRGIDIGASAGGPVLAPADGVVSFAGTVPTGGKTISIQTPLGYTATLLHLGSIGVKRGAVVREGAVIGAAGAESGAEPYVYFGVRTTSDPQGYVDPLRFLPAASVAPSPAPAAAAEVSAQPAAPAEPVVATSEPAAEPTASQSSLEGPATPAATELVIVSRAAELRPGVTVTPRTAGAGVAEQLIRHARPTPTTVKLKPSAERQAAALRAVRVAPAGELSEHIRTDADVRQPSSDRAEAADHHSRTSLLLIGALLVACALAAVVRGRGVNRAARIMSSPEPELSVVRTETEDPRRPGLAICVGQAASGPRGRVRGAGGHLRALPPVEGRRRPDGQRDGRAWDAGDGDGRSRRRLAA